MRRFSWRSGTRPCGRPSPSCRPAASNCSRCCSATRRIPTRKSTWSSASRSEASARSGPVAWIGCAGRAPSPASVRVKQRSTYGEASRVRDDWDDERLLVALGEAVKAREAVPSWFVEMGKNAFAWHNIDAELAQLTYDSHEDRREAAVVRSETASVRSLTFTSAHLTVELEVAASSVLGQIIPP